MSILDSVKECLSGYPSFIIAKVEAIISSYEKEKPELSEGRFDTCPRCHRPFPKITKAGKSSTGKQMYYCHECQERFTANYGSVFFYSHQSEAVWTEFIKHTLACEPMAKTAKALGISESTAFRMRHKMMADLELGEESLKLTGSVELDEKYLIKSHKGLKIKDIKGKKRGEPSSKRGLSDDQICLLTGCSRDGNSFLKAYNMGTPSHEDTLNLLDHIEKETFILKDGSAAYNELIEKLGSKSISLPTHESYDKLNHLNNVNAFHGSIDVIYHRMRGVATKYINRYATLFNTIRLTMKMDSSEAVLFVKRCLKKLVDSFHKIEELSSCGIFNPYDLSWEPEKT